MLRGGGGGGGGGGGFLSAMALPHSMNILCQPPLVVVAKLQVDWLATTAGYFMILLFLSEHVYYYLRTVLDKRKHRAASGLKNPLFGKNDICICV